MALSLLAACGGTPSKQPIEAGSGPSPALPEPESKAIPTSTSRRPRAGAPIRNRPPLPGWK
jgi:hypothetical protein